MYTREQEQQFLYDGYRRLYDLHSHAIRAKTAWDKHGDIKGTLARLDAIELNIRQLRALVERRAAQRS